MDFRLDDEQIALQDAVASFCASRYSLDTIGDREGVPLTSEMWSELAGLGVFSLLVPEADDGLGLGVAEASIVFEQLGRHLVGGPILWSTLGATAVPGLADGSRVVAGFDATGQIDGPIIVEHAAELDLLLVLRAEGVFIIERSGLPDPTVLDSLDPLTPMGCFGDLPTGTQVGDVELADRLRQRGTVLASAFLVGVSDAALQVARDYSLEREQFDQPIGTFQALKHMMADMFVRTSLARSATYAAAAVLDDPVVGHLARSVGGAKLLAGEAAIDNSRAAVQVLGGMGFTWDMLPNYLLKRAWVLENTFGTATSHATSIFDSVASEVS